MKTIQKSKKQFKDLAKSLIKKEDKKILFIHAPKCGGTSLHHSINKSFGPLGFLQGKNIYIDAPTAKKASELFGESPHDYMERLLLYYLSHKKYKYVAGHFHYSDRAFNAFREQWHFITVLRHPVTKWFSDYFYNRSNEGSRFHIDLELEPFIETPWGAYLGRDYVQRFANQVSFQEAETEQAISQSIDILKNNFTLVGNLERMDLFSYDFERIFGKKFHLKKLNKNPVSKKKQKEEISEETKKKVERICEPNLKVYNALFCHS